MVDCSTRLKHAISLWMTTSCLILGCAASAGAQDAAPALPLRGGRVMTVIGGVGNANGWYGVQVERHVAASRLALFGGLGYTPALELGDPSGLTVAGGVRGFTHGVTHRGYLELSVSQIGIEAPGNAYPHGRRLYGPGVQVGYEYLARRGLTLVGSLGIGCAIGLGGERNPLQPMVGFGLGYTWSTKQS